MILTLHVFWHVDGEWHMGYISIFSYELLHATEVNRDQTGIDKT